MSETHLRQLVLPYLQTQYVWAHSTALLARYPTLIPNSHSDQTAPLCFQGTLPITFQGNSYHIPLGIWLPYDYPSTPPNVRVLPTEQMAIRAGPYVDDHGQVRHPYLNSIWLERTQDADLVQLCDILQTCFSQDPPVYARSLASTLDHSLPQKDTSAGAMAAALPPPKLGTMPPQDPFTQAPPLHSPLDYRRIFGGDTESPEEQKQPREDEQERQVMIESIRQKLREDLAAFHEKHHEQVNHVLAQHTKLVEHEQTIDAAHARLLQVEAEVGELLKKGKEIATSTDELEVASDFTPNELIKGRSALEDSKIFDLTAKEHAIDDVIDQLSVALRRGRIDLTTFLKVYTLTSI
ncbi:UEV domain-containing protein [Syncephalis plumigaleata]|nr:UEV domain-containing protein [Syncephalis plumigaleata]